MVLQELSSRQSHVGAQPALGRFEITAAQVIEERADLSLSCLCLPFVDGEMLGGGRRRRRADLDRERSSIRVDSDLYAPGLCGRSPHTTATRSEEHTSELQSLLRISYAVFSLKKKNNQT